MMSQDFDYQSFNPSEGPFESFAHIDISKQYTYVSDLPESITSQFDNCYIDKTLTGCGFTTWILQNPESYIVAVPFKGLIDCKVEQANNDTTGFYPHKVFPFYFDKTVNRKQNLKEYLEFNEIHKIMVTYDSIPNLIQQLKENGIDIKNHFKLFVDECHKVLEFAGNFKPFVVHHLGESFPEFKSVIAATATPSRCEYIPEMFDNFKRIKLNWHNKTEIQIKHTNIKESDILWTVINIAHAHLNGNLEGNVYFFINSVKFSASVTQMLIKAGFDSDNFNIICGKSEKNTKTLKPLKLKQRNSLTDFCKVNFITSTAFEGQDFMDPDGVTYVLSNGKLEHTRIDISTQLPQIIGRLRCSKYKNQVNFIWSYAFTEGETIFSNFIKKTFDKELDVDETIVQFPSYTKTTKFHLINDTKNEIWFLTDTDSEGNVTNFFKNPNASRHLLNSFEGTQYQYYAHNAHGPWPELEDKMIKEETKKHVNYTLNDILAGKIEDNFVIPEMTAAEKLKFGKIPNFSKLVQDYARAKEMCTFGTIAHTERELMHAKEIVHEIENNPAMITIVEYVDEFGTEAALSYVDGSTNLSEKVLMRKLIKNEENKLLEKVISQNFKAGDIIKASEAKDILQQLYNDNAVLAKSKAHHFSLAFKVKKSTVLEDGKRINVLKLKQKH